MSPEVIMQVARDALVVVTLLAAPLLLSALAAGLIIGMFQAATQINEMTLSFIPKLMVIAGALYVAGPWMLNLVTDYARNLIISIPGLIG